MVGKLVEITAIPRLKTLHSVIIHIVYSILLFIMLLSDNPRSQRVALTVSILAVRVVFNYMNNEARGACRFGEPLQKPTTPATTITIGNDDRATLRMRTEKRKCVVQRGLDSSRSEMVLLPRRCPRLLLIQIPTWSMLGPFCIFLRSSRPAVMHCSLLLDLVNSENGRRIVSPSHPRGDSLFFSLSLYLALP